MAKTGGKSQAKSRKAARATASAPPAEAQVSRSVEESLAVLSGGPVPLTARQQEIVNATEGTSEVTAGGVVTADPRQEDSEGVKTPIKADFDNPESGLIYDPKSTLAAPEPPGPVKVGVGETAAQHESHVLMSGAAVVAERLEKEAGPDGLPTDVIARQQHERAARKEFQRVDNNGLADRGQSGEDYAEGKLDAAAQSDEDDD